MTGSVCILAASVSRAIELPCETRSVQQQAWGWHGTEGITDFYRVDPLDTALILDALDAGDAIFFASHLDAIESINQSSMTIGYIIGGPDVATLIAGARAVRTCAAAGTATPRPPTTPTVTCGR